MAQNVVSIHPADLRAIERNLGAIENDLGVIHGAIQTLDSNVDDVKNNVKIVYSELGQLAKDFHDYVRKQQLANRMQLAETRLVKIRQELQKKYGHYDNVRRMTTGILQADDLGIVRTDTISSATEEVMITTPNYWLSPCLVALAAWISDQPDLADKALREGIKRNDEKTSLFFALICRRADRKDACLKWTQRYLENQDEENLDRKTVIILDAFASGLLGADSEGVISRQMTQWLDHLSEKPGFTEQQTKQWSDAIMLKRKPLKEDEYTFLRTYSKTWPILQDIMEGANLHANILAYFMNIFDQQIDTDSLKAQLDEILNSLVSDFDDEELPLRIKEKFEQYIVDYNGDEDRAKKSMELEKTAFLTHKDFTQLLTDAAMNPESSHSSISTQKFAIALSKEWISDAYRDVTAQNRMKIPNEIEINIDTFNSKTTDGRNEEEVVKEFHELVNKEKEQAVSQVKLSGFDIAALYGGIAIAILGLILAVSGGGLFMGIVGIIAGLLLVLVHFSRKNQVQQKRQEIGAYYEKKREEGTQLVRAILAEVVDFRQEFEKKDAESEKVLDYLEQLSPDQYINKMSDSTRRVRV